MGPRFFNRGKYEMSHDAAFTLIGFNGAAVFQPRKVGDRSRSGPGHDSFNGAAVFQPRKGILAAFEPPQFVRLQWGRGFSTAERCLPARLRCRTRRFNGAAVFQPRKASFPELFAALCEASMGPRFFNRGKPPVQLQLYQRVPRHFARGGRSWQHHSDSRTRGKL